MNPRLDIIGDVHGELPALRALGRELGYDVDGDWEHPSGRFLVFLGDLVDRGAYSFEVAELVRRLVVARRAFCIMGNHEYNLVAWHLGVPGYHEPKRSNAPTIADIRRDPARWADVLALFRGLPIGLELPDLRLIHACWHKASLEKVRGVLAASASAAAPPADVFAWVAAHVTLRSPFGERGLLPGLPGDTADERAVIAHEDLMKGYEVPASAPFVDNDGKRRERIRAVWWRDELDAVLTDKPQVFGHYWNLPPIDGEVAPPHPSGHPDLRRWGCALEAKVPASGRLPASSDIMCIDFQGVTNASSARACIGALRWPEREIAWATAEKTSRAGYEA